MTKKIEMFSSVQSKGYNSDGSVIIWFDKQTASASAHRQHWKTKDKNKCKFLNNLFLFIKS